MTLIQNIKKNELAVVYAPESKVIPIQSNSISERNRKRQNVALTTEDLSPESLVSPPGETRDQTSLNNFKSFFFNKLL